MRYSWCVAGQGAALPVDRLPFLWINTFDKILVTGPQRSGTRICAKMISHDTGHRYVDEADIGVDSLYRLWTFLRSEQKLVIQCPALCRYVHLLDVANLAIIMMRRDVSAIILSQKRIGWEWEGLELARYDCRKGVIAEVKYRFWDQFQKDQIDHAFEIEYESLTDHPLWVADELRGDFSPGQTVL